MTDDVTRNRGHVLSDETRLAWLRLIRSENVGARTFRTLINRFGGAEAALDALPQLSQRGGGRAIKVATVSAAKAEMGRAEKLGCRFVCLGEPDYPSLARQAELAPPVLSMMGAPDALNRPAVSVVGARNASLSGIKITDGFVRELGAAGYVVVSGLARGIDAAAHQAALDTGTIGVFAGGLDRPYPEENRPLMRRIVDAGGCLVSEMPFGWEPRARDFPRRNRVVAALGLGLVVVEAAVRSGSLISARLAGELGRLVFAVPGSPLDPRAEGTNRLIREGAVLVTRGDDIVEALRPLDGRTSVNNAVVIEEPDADWRDEPGEGDRGRIIEALGPTPADIDDIILHTRNSAGVVQLVLLELDLAGRLERHVDGRVSLLS